MCSLDETLARVRAVVGGASVMWIHNYAVDDWNSASLRMRLRVDAVPLRLGPKEYLLLEFLILKRGSAVSKTACMTHLYGTDEYPEAKTIDVVLCRLRKRLAPHGWRT